MLDANDIQIISKIVSDALAEERKHTEAMFAEERKHTEVSLAGERKHTEALFAEERKHIMAMFSQQKSEIHADMMTIVESDIYPKLRILAEGHETLLERMTPPAEIESMKADIVVLKEAVQHLSAKVNAMQKAQ